MRFRRLGLGTGTMVATALLAWACGSEDSSSSPDDGRAGASDDAGAGGPGGISGSGAGGPDNAAGGAGAPNGNDDVPWCGPYSLDDLCARPSMPCEVAPEDLCPRCEDGGKVLPCPHPKAAHRYETTCGGFVIIQDLGLFGSQSWEFDANGELVGVLSGSDAYSTCDGGGSSASTLYGAEPCERVPQETAGSCDGFGGAGGQTGSGGQGGVGDGAGGMGGAN